MGCSPKGKRQGCALKSPQQSWPGLHRNNAVPTNRMGQHLCSLVNLEGIGRMSLGGCSSARPRWGAVPAKHNWAHSLHVNLPLSPMEGLYLACDAVVHKGPDLLGFTWIKVPFASCEKLQVTSLQGLNSAPWKLWAGSLPQICGESLGGAGLG